MGTPLGLGLMVSSITFVITDESAATVLGVVGFDIVNEDGVSVLVLMGGALCDPLLIMSNVEVLDGADNDGVAFRAKKGEIDDVEIEDGDASPSVLITITGKTV